MPRSLIFHEGNTFPLQCAGNDCHRLAFNGLRLVKCLFKLLDIISVLYADYMEFKCLKLLINRIRRADVFDGAVNL